MNNRAHVLRLTLLLFLLAFGAGAAAAQGDVPAGGNADTRVRVAHLAPFAGAIPATQVTVTANGQSLGSFRYGDRSNYITLNDGAATYQINITANGNVAGTATLAIGEGDYALVIIGNKTTLPVTATLFPEDGAPPAPGKTALRFAHVSPFAAELEASRVDFCTINNVPFDNTSNGLAYKKYSRFKDIPPSTYVNLKITRANLDNPCTGSLLLKVPDLTLAEGEITTLYFIGTQGAPAGGYNVFTFEKGIIGFTPEPTGQDIFLPMVTR